MPGFREFCLGVLATTTLVLASIGGAAAQDARSYAERLEAGEINPLGGIRAGNGDGTIPAWKCGADGRPESIPDDFNVLTEAQAYANPYADEEPRFVITAENYQKYKGKLTKGLQKMFEQYPNEFRMRVFPTHRTACYSKRFYDNVAQNAREASLDESGYKVSDTYMGPPFPVADNGLEAIWSHLLAYKAWREYAYYRGVAVYPDGSKAWQLTEYDIIAPYGGFPEISRREYLAREAPIIQSYSLLHTLVPERQRGTYSLTYSYLDKERMRKTWQYLPGTRRVRRFPYFGYDIPQGAGGLRGVDEDRLFNGPPDRFNWELVGRREMFVPYNTYAIDSAEFSYDDVLGQHTVNPDLMRWELHRVYKVVATRQDDARHWYKKRVYYIDEDSWNAMLADNYDDRMKLWRTSWQSFQWDPRLPGLQARTAVYHDFQADAYTAQRLINEEPVENRPKLNHDTEWTRTRYTPGGLRTLGRR